MTNKELSKIKELIEVVPADYAEVLNKLLDKYKEFKKLQSHVARLKSNDRTR
jgi:hypothetical protein